jgi:hypothetical protein
MLPVAPDVHSRVATVMITIVGPIVLRVITAIVIIVIGSLWRAPVLDLNDADAHHVT